MIPGFDYLAGLMYEQAMLSAHRRGWCAAIFLRTFGDARKTLEAMCRRGTFSEIVVHLAPFDRTHTYTVQKYIAQLISDAKFCEALQKKYPNTKLLLSPFCEHNHSASTMIPVFQSLSKAAPSCLMVNSIWKGAVIPGIITEIHLQNSRLPRKPPGEYIISFDGFGGKGEGDFTDANIQLIMETYPDARQIRGWDFRANGKYGHNDTHDVQHRIHWPNKEYLQSRLAVMKQREGSLTYPKDALYKPCADDHGNAEPTKDNKAMVITKKNAESLNVYDSQGHKIDTLRRVRPNFNSKGPLYGYPRYYSTKYAFQIAALARKNTGSSLIKIDKLPLTDGDLRSGYK